MSTAEWTNRWMERAGDWLNPILVKETRQALKSRQFLAAFMLLLAAAWLIAVFGMLQQGANLQYGAAGRDFFFFFYIALAAAALVVVPFGAFRSLQGERDFNTFELLSITTLKPRQIVWGKLFSAGVQLLIFYSAITPFIAFSSLLQGFDVPRFALILVLTALMSLMLSMTALMLSTVSRQRVAQGILSIAALGGLVMTFSGAVSLVGETVHGFDILPITEWEFWAVLGLMFIGYASYFVLFQQITTAQLTFESDNRSTGIRITALVQFVLLWTCVMGGVLYYKAPMFEEPLEVMASICGVHWLVFGGFMATEEDTLSRRVGRGLPRNRLVRLLTVPFMPGGGRGYLNLVLQVALLWWVVAGVVAWYGVSDWRWTPGGGASGGSMIRSQFGGEGMIAFLTELASGEYRAWNPAVQFTTAVCCYLLAYVGVGAALGRWGMALSHEVRPAHARVVTVLILVAGLIWPFIPRMAELIRWNGYSPIDITNPVVTLAELAERSSVQWQILTLLWLGAGLGVLLNLPAMWRGVVEVLRVQRRPRPVEPDDAPEAILEQAQSVG